LLDFPTARTARRASNKPAMAKQKALSSPVQLKTFDKKKEFLRVVIETPKGSRNKFKYDPELATYRLNSVLPE
jgi:inorganic pyrophosphatase